MKNDLEIIEILIVHEICRSKCHLIEMYDLLGKYKHVTRYTFQVHIFKIQESRNGYTWTCIFDFLRPVEECVFGEGSVMRLI